MLRTRVSARRAFLVLLLLAQFAAAADSKSLASKIDKILAEPDVARGMWGVEVNSGEVVEVAGIG